MPKSIHTWKYAWKYTWNFPESIHLATAFDATRRIRGRSSRSWSRMTRSFGKHWIFQRGIMTAKDHTYHQMIYHCILKNLFKFQGSSGILCLNKVLFLLKQRKGKKLGNIFFSFIYTGCHRKVKKNHLVLHPYTVTL